MTAKDRLLTEEEAKNIILKGWCSPETTEADIAIEPWVEAIRDAQDAKTLRALRPVVEYTANQPCRRVLQAAVVGQTSRADCGHCATCQARVVLAELDAQGKGKEG